MGEMLSSEDEEDIATLISSDGSEVEEELDVEDMCETNQPDPSPNKSKSKAKAIEKQEPEGPKLLPRRKPERPKTLPTLKEHQRYPRPSSKASDYSLEFDSDDDVDESANFQKSKTKTTTTPTTNQKKMVNQRRMVSPYGQYFLSIGTRSSSLESRGSTIIDAVFDDNLKKVFDEGLGSRPGHVAKRISSAKARWNKERMNDLATMHRQILELTDENRTLNRVVKRQSLALNRLAGTEGELPILLRAHNEETRVLRQKMKQAQEMNKIFEHKFEQKSKEINQLRETNKRLESLSQNKQLRERGKLDLELDDVKMHLQSRDKEVRELYHKILILEKSSRQQLKLERGRVTGLKKKLDEAEQEIKRLKDIIQEKEKIINRSYIYSRQFLTPSASYGNLGYGSISAGNSVNSLRAPSGSGHLSSKSKARSKSYQANIGKTEKDPSSIHSDEDYEWGLTENKKSFVDNKQGKKTKNNTIRLTRHALAFKKGLTGKSKSGSSSSSSSSSSSDNDEDRDGVSTLNGVEDMPEGLERKDGSDDEEFELSEDFAQHLVHDVEEKLAQLMNEDTSDDKDSDRQANSEKDVSKLVENTNEITEDLGPKIDNAKDDNLTTEDLGDIHPTMGFDVAQSVETEPDCHPTIDKPMDLNLSNDNQRDVNPTTNTAAEINTPTNNPADVNPSTAHPIMSDEEDEGIGNGETQSEKDGDTPAELKQDIEQTPDDNEDEEISDSEDDKDSKEKDKILVQKLGLWLPKEMHPRSEIQVSNHRTSSLILSGDRKSNLLAKLRDLDAENGVQNSRQDSSYVPSFGFSAGRGGRSGSATRNLLLNGSHTSDTPFTSALLRDAPSSASSSPSSSIKSVAVANGVIDQKKKALLMSELFGADVQT